MKLRSAKLTIWCNAKFSDAVMRRLDAGTRAHRLVHAATASTSVLAAGREDPALAAADVAIGIGGGCRRAQVDFACCQRDLQVVLGDEARLNQALTDLLAHSLDPLVSLATSGIAGGPALFRSRVQISVEVRNLRAFKYMVTKSLRNSGRTVTTPRSWSALSQ